MVLLLVLAWISDKPICGLWLVALTQPPLYLVPAVLFLTSTEAA
jgi:hypothetical protein